MKIAVLGATGRVGRLVCALARDEVVALVARSGAGSDLASLVGGAPTGVRVVALGPGCFGDAEVVIDFSLPEALDAALDHMGSRALVTGTTGLPPSLRARLDAQAAHAPVLEAANFSTGVTLLAALVATAARALPDYDIEIVEAHHARKRDAPSGTALLLAHSAADARGVALDDVVVHGRSGHTGERPAGQIGVHALRCGDVVGEHTVWLAGAGDRLQLGHVATSRETFAQGALRAARWIAGRPPGRYGMRDVLGV